jgi:hypothetical protein
MSALGSACVPSNCSGGAKPSVPACWNVSPGAAFSRFFAIPKSASFLPYAANGEHVLGLEVPVHDVRRVQLLQALCHFYRDGMRVARAQTGLAAPVHVQLEIAAIGKLGDERHIAALSSDIAHVEDVFAVSVLEAPVNVRLAL